MSELAALPIERMSRAGFAGSGSDARLFCLATIRQVYGIDYHPDWHADLDSLVLSETDNWFSNESRGAFFVVRNTGRQIIATGGLYDMGRKPKTAARFSGRYQGARVCQIVRVYLDAAVRRQGLGTRIANMLEAEATALGYDVSYLHADAQTTDTLRFWGASGYQEFDRFSYPSPTGTDTSVDFDKTLNPMAVE